tara:strand:+ start:78 stop:536 length:459 start_codon:yes stop_codon:yes gene_type:complete
MTYYIYEVPGHKNGATIDWHRRAVCNFGRLDVDPILIETMEGPDTEEYWQVVGDREWYYADLNGYDKGVHYKVIRITQLKALTVESRRKWRISRDNSSYVMHTKNRGLTMEQAREIRSKYIPRKVSIYMLAAEYNTGHRTIWNIIKNKTYNE